MLVVSDHLDRKHKQMHTTFFGIKEKQVSALKNVLTHVSKSRVCSNFSAKEQNSQIAKERLVNTNILRIVLFL
jgi:hypothetical protein